LLTHIYINHTHCTHSCLFLFFMIPPPPTSTLFPYTTLFRSIGVYVPPPSLFSGTTPPFVGVPHGAFVKHVPYRKGWMRLVFDERSEEHTSELQSRGHLVCRLLLEKKKNKDM